MQGQRGTFGFHEQGESTRLKIYFYVTAIWFHANPTLRDYRATTRTWTCCPCNRMLLQVPEDGLPDLLNISTPPIQDNSTPFFISSYPPDPSILHSKNKVFLDSLTSNNIEPQFKTHIRRLSAISERLQTVVTILQKELKEVKEIDARWKERASGKRLILKDKVVVSTEEVHQALAEAEKATAVKKAKKGNQQKGWKRKIASESEE